MSLKDYTEEQLKNMSMIELASHILFDEKKALDFNELYDRISELKGFSETEKAERMAQFYTDLNVDGRYTTLGSNIWGMKRWYPVEQAEEEVHTPKKKKKKPKKKNVEEDDYIDEDVLDEVDDEVEELTDDFDDDDDDADDLEELDDDLEEFDDDIEDEELEEIDEEFDDEEFEEEELDEDEKE